MCINVLRHKSSGRPVGSWLFERSIPSSVLVTVFMTVLLTRDVDADGGINGRVDSNAAVALREDVGLIAKESKRSGSAINIVKQKRDRRKST